MNVIHLKHGKDGNFSQVRPMPYSGSSRERGTPSGRVKESVTGAGRLRE